MQRIPKGTSGSDFFCGGFRSHGKHLFHPVGGDNTPLPPALNGGVVPVPELSSEPSDASKASDDVAMIGHTHGVRVQSTRVNLECVRAACETLYVQEDQTIGARVRLLVAKAGLSVREFASAAGYSHGSGVQRYLDAEHDKPISLDVAKRFAEALVGKGQPPIEYDEVMALTGFDPAERPESNGIPVKMEGASTERMREDLPIYGTALGAVRVVEGEAIEQTTLNTAEVVHYAKRPVILNGRADAYGLYVAGSSMYPAHPDGGIILVDGKRPARIGDDVVVYLRPTNGELDDGMAARAVLVKRLVKRTASYLELEQFNPAKIFRIERTEIVQEHRVIPWAELLS